MDDLDKLMEQVAALGGDPDTIVRFLTEMYHEATLKAEEGGLLVTYTVPMSWSVYRILFPRRARIVGMLNKVKR